MVVGKTLAMYAPISRRVSPWKTKLANKLTEGLTLHSTGGSTMQEARRQHDQRQQQQLYVVDPYDHPQRQVWDDQGASETGYMANNRDGKSLFCRYWKPRGKPRALVCLSHGLGEHLMWYSTLARIFADRGCLTFGHDHVGHGKSDGTRVYIDSFDEYGDDIIQHVGVMKKMYPDVPIFSIGFSMGALVILRTYLRQPGIFRGMITLSPMIYFHSKVAKPYRSMVLYLLQRFIPEFQFSKFNPWVLTRDPEMRDRLMHDPLVWKGGVRLACLTSCLKISKQVVNNFGKIDVPLRILHGDSDRIADFTGSQQLYNQAGTKDKFLKIYPGAKHQLLAEIPQVREEIISDTVEWLCSRIEQENH